MKFPVLKKLQPTPRAGKFFAANLFPTFLQAGNIFRPNLLANPEAHRGNIYFLCQSQTSGKIFPQISIPKYTSGVLESAVRQYLLAVSDYER